MAFLIHVRVVRGPSQNAHPTTQHTTKWKILH